MALQEYKTSQQKASRRSYLRHKDRLLAEQKKKKPWAGKKRDRDPEVYRRYKANRFGHIRRFIIAYKKAHPCVDCGEKDIVVLQFDHRDNIPKLFNIGQFDTLGITDLSVVQAEIAKCDVRCANDHIRRTAKQRQFNKQYA